MSGEESDIHGDTHMNTTTTTAALEGDLDTVVAGLLDHLNTIGDPFAYAQARHDWADDLLDRMLWDLVVWTDFRCHAACGGLIVRIYDRHTNERVARLAWDAEIERWIDMNDLSEVTS
jgi:hypothetical protein